MCVLAMVFLKKRTVQWGVFDVAYIVFMIGAWVGVYSDIAYVVFMIDVWIDVYAVMRSVLSGIVYRRDIWHRMASASAHTGGSIHLQSRGFCTCGGWWVI